MQVIDIYKWCKEIESLKINACASNTLKQTKESHMISSKANLLWNGFIKLDVSDVEGINAYKGLYDNISQEYMNMVRK